MSAINLRAGLQEPQDGRNDLFEGNERDIDDDDIDRFRDQRRVQFPDIGPFDHDDPFVLPDLPRHLAVPDIHGIDLRGPVLQQAIGEPAGGCADIESGLVPLQ